MTLLLMMTMIDKGSMTQGVTEQSMTARRTMVSDAKTESSFIVTHSRDDKSQEDSSWSWQTVLITISSVAVLLLVTGIVVWKLHQWAIATKSNSRIVCCRNKLFIHYL